MRCSHRFIQSTDSGMDAHELARSVLTILKSDSNTIDLQMPLFELLGPESFDFIQLVCRCAFSNFVLTAFQQLLDKRIALLESLFAPKPSSSPPPPARKGRPMPTAGGSVTIRTADEILVDKLKRKEQQQRRKQANRGGKRNKSGVKEKAKATLPAEWFDASGALLDPVRVVCVC